MSFLSKSNIFSLLLAIGLPGAILLILLIDLAHQPVPPAPAATAQVAIAEITKSQQAVWGEGFEKLSRGTQLFSDRQLQLTSGLVELTYVSGATVLIEGPATFQIDDANRGFLKTGTLVAMVPKVARGFTIDTPMAEIVDHGTNFGVSVEEDGAVEAHVFKGEVEVAVKSTSGHPVPPELLLREKQAARVRLGDTGNAPRIDTICVNPARFARCLSTPKPDPQVFAVHRGDIDPETEGWRPLVFQKSKILRIDPDRSIAAPVNDGTPAWWMANFVKEREFQYRKTFTPETIRQSKDKGWSLRSRIKVVENDTDVYSSCHVTFSDGMGQRWSFTVTRDKDGSQYVRIYGQTSLGDNGRYTIPNSRDRYVEYELRCGPGSEEAELYANGQQIASGIGFEETSKVRAVRFGLARHATKAHFAFVEWGLLDESS